MKEGKNILLICLSGHGSLGHSLLTEKLRVENSFVTSDNDLITNTFLRS